MGRDAFLERGHDAGSPVTYCRRSVRGHTYRAMYMAARLRDPWDLVIAHPPCNYLSHINRWFRNDRRPDFSREDAVRLSWTFSWTAIRLMHHGGVWKIELSMPVVRRFLGNPDDRIEPYWFGEQYHKLTWLWLRGLPLLVRTGVYPTPRPFVRINNGRNDAR